MAKVFENISKVKFFENISKQYINGKWADGSSGRTESIYDPYDNTIFTEVVLANTEDIDAAYKAAKEAQVKWAKVDSKTKRDILLKAADILEEHYDEAKDLLIRETGSTHIKADGELQTILGDIRYSATYPELMDGYTVEHSVIPGKENRLYKKPLGVIGIISPFNFPATLSVRAVAPAIATGNAVVLKPASQTGISGGAIVARIFELAGLPAGVLNVVLSDAKEIGDYFIEHPIPQHISFTGSTEVGRHIGEVAGRNLKMVGLELGGNNPLIILKDSNIDRAVETAAFGRHYHNGQVCVSTNRILVQRDIYDEFVEKYVAKVSSLKYGDPKDPANLIGPIINERQIQKVLDFVQLGLEEGAKLVLKGERIGNVLSPFVFKDVKNDSKLAQSEMFGPVSMIIPFESEEEAIELANGVECGLSSAIFTGDIEHGFELAYKIDSGMTHINDITVQGEPHVPFGGTKSSGIGRFGGHWIFEEYTSQKWVSVQKEYRNYGI